MENTTETVRLTVYVAENGRSIDLECPNSVSVEVVQTTLASLISVPLNDQLLICGDSRLEPQRMLASYRLPSEGRNIFLFNRARLLADSPPPPQEELHIREIVMPAPPAASPSGHPLEKSSDPAVKALPSYERQFRFHFQKGNAIFNATHDRFEACRQLLQEQKVQNMAINTAMSNMDYYYKIICQHHSEFMKRFNRQQKEHADIVTNFSSDLDHLKRCTLHPSLVADGRETLFECVDAVNLNKQAEVCANSHKHFQAKVLQLKTMFSDLQQNVKELYQNTPSVDIRMQERSITEYVSFVEEEKIIMQSLSKDANTVRKLIDECMSKNPSTSVRPHDAVSALGPMYHVHVNNHLPKMEICYQRVDKLLEAFKGRKHEMSTFVHTCMQRVAVLQSRIRDVRNQLSAFKEAMSHQDEIFGELKVVRQIGPAYRACLAEIVRRKAGMKLYMGQAGQLAEKMARNREAEIARREEFLRTRGSLLPRDILVSLGLISVPSQCIVNIDPYDTNLLAIDMLDLEKFAPMSMFVPRIGSITGRHVSESQNVEDSITTAADAAVDDDVNVDIAGTSKLEVENAWLKAELASTIALLCTFDPYFDSASEGNESDKSSSESRAVQKTAEALALKDDYTKHLKNILEASQQQCSSYKSRVQELEQMLAEQHQQIQRLESNSGLSVPITGIIASKSEQSEVTADYAQLSPSSGRNGQPNQSEGVDESMIELSNAGCIGDATMLEGEDSQATGVRIENSTIDFLSQEFNISSERTASIGNKEIEHLQDALLEKTKHCIAVEEKLKIAINDIDSLRKELQEKGGLLDECQFNCAELETSLHDAREEARIKQCFADRKAAEYNALRTSSVRLCGLLQRLRQCVLDSPPGGKALAESLRSLASSLASNEAGDEGTSDFCQCVRTLADRVGLLAQQQSDLLERCNLVEASKDRLSKDLEAKIELLKNQHAKRKIDKQAHKEKICYTRFQVHELAMFSKNSAGHYEAINRGCPNYYLSDESMALFLQNGADTHPYIIGQIVHIQKNIVRTPTNSMMTGSLDASSSACANPYGLPVGTIYFVVTLAMIPDRMPSPLSLQRVDNT